jgi:hypothetical protein
MVATGTAALLLVDGLRRVYPMYVNTNTMVPSPTKIAAIRSPLKA